MSDAGAMPPPYDVHNFLNLLGIEIDDHDRDVLAGRFTVTHSLIAGTGYLWAPVVITLADALCAFGVSRHWPDGAASFTTVEIQGELHVERARRRARYRRSHAVT